VARTETWVTSHVEVRYKDVEDTIFDGLSRNRDIKRALRRFIYDIHDTWVFIWDSSMEGVLAQETGKPHPYATGSYRRNIKKKELSLGQRLWIKRALRKGGVMVGLVYNDDPKAHWIEYGTNEDKPGSRSPWGPKTPTPEFAPMRRTVAAMERKPNVR
jgi:hypothetical protein